MRRIWLTLTAAMLCFCLASCRRETQIDPVLFCTDFNRRSKTVQLREEDAYLRADGEVVLFCDAGLVRLQTTADGAVLTAVVTGEQSDDLCRLAADAFGVLADPLSEDVPSELSVMLQNAERSVRSTETKRFWYFVCITDGVLTVVQMNRLLVSLPVQPTLRLE